MTVLKHRLEHSIVIFLLCLPPGKFLPLLKMLKVFVLKVLKYLRHVTGFQSEAFNECCALALAWVSSAFP